MMSEAVIRRTKLLVFAAAFLLSLALGAVAQRVPQFRSYPAGPVAFDIHAAPDLSSTDAYQYRTRLREAAAQGVNFAGHYRPVYWGCGTGCLMGAAIDEYTGKVSFFPFSLCCSAKLGDPAFLPIEFRQESRLVVFSGKRNEEGLDAAHFYEFTGAGFSFIMSVPYAGAVEDKLATSAVIPNRCRSISDSMLRLSCYDSANPPISQNQADAKSDEAPALPETAEVEKEEVRRVEEEVRAYAASRGETVDEFAARVGSSPSKIEALVFAMEKTGGGTAADALRSFENFAVALQDPGKSEPASAGQPIPHYDPDLTCDHMASNGRPDERGAFRHVCIENEQAGYETLKNDWASASLEEQNEAIKMARNPSGYPGGSYAALAIYLGVVIRRDENYQRLKAMKQQNHPKFD